MASADPKDEFVNNTEGFIGVITVDPNGKEKAIAVRPKQSVWLTEAEQILTANAPRNDDDNPFQNGDLTLKTKAADIKNRRPIGNQQALEGAEDAPEATENGGSTKPRTEADQKRQKEEKEREKQAQKQGQAGALPVEETGASVSPKGTPETGKRAKGEEVGTPDAPGKDES